MSRPSGGPDTPQRNKNNIPDLLRTMPVKVSVEDGQSSTKRRWERGLRDLVRFALLMRRMGWIGLCQKDRESRCE